MYIDHIKLTNYRNYHSLTIDFNNGLTILTGENAQGKTNLLEAIFLLSLAKSHRTNHDQDLIRWGEDIAKIQTQVITKNYHFPLELVLNSKGKIAKINHLEQRKLSSFIGKLNVILFAPEELQMVKGSPQVRRKFLDTELGQAYPIYLQSLLQYHSILKQRNKYLKDFGYSDKFDDMYFEILTDQLIDSAMVIIKYRIDFIDKLQEIAYPIHTMLSNQRDHLLIQYVSHSAKLNYKDRDTIESQFRDFFSLNIKKEKERGLTLIGPHRDDLNFYINQKPADLFGSQGQQRTIVLSMKLAEIELLHDITGEYPILLLDDVLSELDDQRKHILMSHIENKVQTFLTTATIKGLNLDLLNKSQILHVNQGEIRSNES